MTEPHHREARVFYAPKLAGAGAGVELLEGLLFQCEMQAIVVQQGQESLHEGKLGARTQEFGETVV